MLAGERGDARRELVSSDLTAIITGPFAWTFGAAEPQSANDTYPDRLQPFREFAIHYHDDFVATQAFPRIQRRPTWPYTLQGGAGLLRDQLRHGGIGRRSGPTASGVGPMQQCATCKFEEFFLSSWAVGDPAMVVDFPANWWRDHPPEDRATKGVLYPDDPSNVYHSYLATTSSSGSCTPGRTSLTSTTSTPTSGCTRPNSDESHYLDSQMISPGGAYTLEMVYGGSGNRTRRWATRSSTATSTRTSRRGCGRCGASTTCSKPAPSSMRDGGPASRLEPRAARRRDRQRHADPGHRADADAADGADARRASRSVRSTSHGLRAVPATCPAAPPRPVVPMPVRPRDPA